MVAREAQVESSTAQSLVKLAHSLRRLSHHDLEESVSTRLLIYAGKLIRAGFTPRQACRAAIVDALTDDHETATALDEVVHAIWPT